MNHIWSATVDAAVDDAIGELLDAFPGSQVSIREVLDDRGVVAILAAVGDGRLMVAGRTVDLAPIVWPWQGGVASTVGLLPSGEVPTVAELCAGLVVAG